MRITLDSNNAKQYNALTAVGVRFRVVMHFSAFRFLVFVCTAALCLTVGCRDDSGRGKGYNLLDTSKNTRRDTPRPPRVTPADDPARRVSDALQRAGDPEKRRASQQLIPYAVCLTVVAVVVGGLLYWQTRLRKRAEWELNDPMALVQELNFVHQLSEPEKKWMKELAERNALPNPLKIFVEPKFLLEAWEDISFNPERPMIRRLLSRLFEITVQGPGSDSAVSSNATTQAPGNVNPSVNNLSASTFSEVGGSSVRSTG